MPRLYIRIKTRYDPANANEELLFVDAQPTTTVGRVKEEAKRKTNGSKIDSLYLLGEDGSYGSLADDRLISYYNIQDRTVLETTSNPFWAAAIYARLNEVKNHAAENPQDTGAVKGAEKSAICRYMALGILFNGSNKEGNQPPYFESLEELCNHLMTAGKKPAYMSQTTRNTLQAMKDDFMLNDQHVRDPVGRFIHKQAVRLGFAIENDGENVDVRDGINDIEQIAGRGNNVEARIRNHVEHRADERPNAQGHGRDNNRQQNGPRRGRRRAVPVQTCQYCDESVATVYCAECQPPLILCDHCATVLHARDRRRNHQLQDVSQGPAPARSTGYHPQPYRAPFAMLVAFYRALREVPSRMSLTADELKARAQPLTGTDLEDKQGAKRFSGFDSLENALIKNELVVKMADRPPRYSLLEVGETLASKCSEFDYAVQSYRQQESVPVVPITGVRPVFRNRQICLLVDSEEPLKDRFIRVVKQKGLSVKMRKLPVGDFAWILLPPGVNPDTARDMPEQELVLPYLVERKTWGDLWASSKTNRFVNQVQRMKGCGLENLFYLVEGSPKDIYGNPGVEVQNYLQNLIDKLMLEDKFFVNRTGSWLKTVMWLCHLTNMASEKLNAGPTPNLMTFSEFSKAGRKKRHDERALTRDLPVKSTEWKTSDYVDIIRSHYHDNVALTNAPGLPGRLPGRLPGNLPKDHEFLLIIQGLTAYNTRCHSLLNRTLADLLKNTAQAVEECVQRHLQGLTNQLIDQDVFQYYILWLQVFKGVMVRRTETDNETETIMMTTTKQGNAGHAVHPTYFIQEVSGTQEQATEVPVTENRMVGAQVMFANDSQEEELMLQQALTHSMAYTSSAAEDVRYPVEDCGVGPSGHSMHTADANPAQTFAGEASKSSELPFSSSGPIKARPANELSEEEQLKLVMEISKAEFKAQQSTTLSKESFIEKDSPSLQSIETVSSTTRKKFDQKPTLSLNMQVSTSCSSEWKNLHQKPQESFNGTVAGSCQEDAILLDSQEFDVDVPEVLEVPSASPNSPAPQQSYQDDYAYALKIHEELNKSSLDELSTSAAQNDIKHHSQGKVEIVGIGVDLPQKFQDNPGNQARTIAGPQSLGTEMKAVDEDLAFALEIQQQLNAGSGAGVTNTAVQKDKHAFETEAIHEDDDYAYALKLQQELNSDNQATKSLSASSGISHIVGRAEMANDQLLAYREKQKQKFGAKTNKADKLSPGSAFRKNVRAIAAGRAVPVGIANPVSNSSPVSGRLASNQNDRRSIGSPVSQKPSCFDGQSTSQHSQPNNSNNKSGNLSASSSNTGQGTLVFPIDHTSSSSSCCSGSPSRSVDHRKGEPPVLVIPGCSSSMASPSNDASLKNNICPSGSPNYRTAGPKCGACGNIGHSRSSTKCPQYYSLESRLKREERARKRKADKEAEERELQDRLGNLATQRIDLENQTVALGRQLEVLRRQSSDLVNTHKLVEDALSSKRKRKR